MKNAVYTLLIALAVALWAPAARAQNSSADAYKELATWEFGKSRLPLATIEDEIRKATPSQYPEIEAKLLDVLKNPSTPKDAKRYICRYLSVVGSAKCVAPVAELLSDPDVSHLARYALEPNADPSAAAALRGALGKVQGKLLAGVISSVGARRDAAAVGDLAKLAADSDPMIAAAAMSAIGAIGTPEAVKALDAISAPEALARTLARAKITCASQLVAAGNRTAAMPVFQAMAQASQPKAIRVAGLKGLMTAVDSNAGAKLIIQTVQGDDADLRNAAVAAFIGSNDKALKDAVAAQVPGTNAAAQVLLLGVLADQTDVNVRPAVLSILSNSQDGQVRAAALECLVRHGEAADVPVVVKIANGQGAEADAARKTLERMSNKGVDEAIATLIESPDAGTRKVVLGVLANRRAAAALPILVKIVSGGDAALAAEAAKGLAILGTPAQLPELSAVVAATNDASVRTAAEDAIKAICTRAADKEACAKPLLASLEKASSAEAKSSLVKLLAFTRGEAALAAVKQAMSDPAVRDVAFRTLTEWPELTAAPVLIGLARDAQDTKTPVLAIRGCIRLAGLKDQSMSQRLAIYREVLGIATRAEEKKQVIAGLSELPSPGALELLEKCAAQQDLSSDAILATARLAKQLKVAYQKRALASLDAVKQYASTDELRTQVNDAVAEVKNAGQAPDGMVVAWMLAGPYTEEGKAGPEMFDEALAPEKKDAKVEWRPVLPSAGGMVELDKILGGNERVAYLKTEIYSNVAQEAQLEMGSDDGLKVFLNGKAVYGNNATRPHAYGSDKVKVKLNEGRNVLMLKIIQGGGQWAASCKIRSPQGGALKGISVSPTGE